MECPALLGHSLGGIVATKFAILFPDSLSKLIIYDSPLAEGFWRNVGLIREVPFKGVLMLSSVLIPGLGRLAFRLRGPKTMRLMLEAICVFYDPSHFTQEMIQEGLRNSYEAISQSVWHAVVFENLLQDLGRISVPTLIIRGDHDLVVPQHRMERASAKIPNSKRVVIERAGHLSLIEQPEQFNQAVYRFLLGSSEA